MPKMSDLLIKAGVKRPVAKVVEVLSDYQYHTMREIEREADLRQPEVSLVVKVLDGYVTIETQQGDRGRPQNVVSMKKPNLVAFISDQKKRAESERKDADDAFAALRKMVG